MNKEALRSDMILRGWRLDRWGHLQKEMKFTNAKTLEVSLHLMRLKFQKSSVRIERGYRTAVAGSERTENSWVRVGGAYYSAISKDQYGSIRIGNKVFKPL